MELTDEQWVIVETLLPKPVKRADGKGRPRVDDRAILNGILWIMRTGAPWHDMPSRYPAYQTCHRRFQECFIEGTFVMPKKGRRGWEKSSRVMVQNSWQWQMALVFLSRYPLEVLRRMK